MLSGSCRCRERSGEISSLNEGPMGGGKEARSITRATSWQEFMTRAAARYGDEEFWQAALAKLDRIPVGVTFTYKDVRPDSRGTVADLLLFCLRNGVVAVVEEEGGQKRRPARAYQRLM